MNDNLYDFGQIHIDHKNNDKNIVDQTYTNYIHIDSSKRNKISITETSGQLYNLQEHPLNFTNNSSVVTIDFPNNPFKNNDKIALSNIISKNIMLQDVIMVKKNSYFIRILHENHGYSLYNTIENENFTKIDYVDILPKTFNETDNISDGTVEYYVLENNDKFNLSITLSNVKKSIGNIPLNYLNDTHVVFLLYTKKNNNYIMEPNSYLIKLQYPSSINYKDGLTTHNTSIIKMNNLYSIPLELINQSDKTPYFTVFNSQQNKFSIDISYNAIVSSNNAKGGGDNGFIKLITNIIMGYPDPSEYVIYLDRTYNNIINVQIVSSTFPNNRNIISNKNNKLYWRNFSDGNYYYCIEIANGNYTLKQLQMVIQNKLNSTLKYEYSNESKKQQTPKIINNLTPINFKKYDENGNNKYHSFDVSISEHNFISFINFNEIEKYDNALKIPDVYATMKISNLSPTYLYFTDNNYASMKNNFYKINNLINDTFEASIELEQSVIINFIYANSNILNSINSQTQLLNFYYNEFTNNLFLQDHQMKLNDIIITDQFNDTNKIYIVSIVVDSNNCVVLPSEITIIYDNLLINQTISLNNSTISDISIDKTKNDILIVQHDGHQMVENNYVIISGSNIINYVPSHIINAKHIISKIINNNSYLIYIEKYALETIEHVNALIKIKTPALFQMSFLMANNMGNILGFDSFNTPFMKVISGNKSINLKTPDYFYICCDELKSEIKNTIPVTDVMAIINISSDCHILKDTFVPIQNAYNNKKTLSDLHFKIKDKFNEYVDFNNIDHSFVIEITEIYSQPNKTDLDHKFGYEINSKKLKN